MLYSPQSITRVHAFAKEIVLDVIFKADNLDAELNAFNFAMAGYTFDRVYEINLIVISRGAVPRIQLETTR